MQNYPCFNFCSVIFLLLFAGFYRIGAQDGSQPKVEEKPAVALLRHRQAKTTIETIVEARPASGSSVSVAVYQAEGKVTRKIADIAHAKACADPLIPGVICLDESFSHPGKTIFVYSLPTAAVAANKYFVAFSLNDEKKGKIDQIVQASLDFQEIKPVVEPFDREQQFHTNSGYRKVDFRPNGVIKIPIEFPAPNNPLNEEFDTYVEQRINALYDYLDPKTVTPAKIATVRAEPQTEDVPPQFYNVIGLQIDPDGRQRAKVRRLISISLITDRKFPAEKFALEVVFNDNPPPELKGRLLNTLDGIAHRKPEEASKVGGDEKLGLRSFKGNLDLGLAYTSAVEEEEDEGVKVRRRKSNTVVDLMFAPLHNLPLDRNEVHFFTPFFIDAKISSGKIKEKTLSLNRILLGTEYSVRWRPDDGNFNKYIFSFRGINASDRDFKRAEGKFNFEFRPIFNKLNNPLTVQYKDPLPDSVLIPENGKKYVQTGWFGYQIQPFIGFEVGRIYREKREPFTNEETSRNIRRLILGTDLVFNVTKYANIKLTDVFYIRGESASAKNRNYFNGTLEAPILTSGNTAQSVFFSFERGDQPPFATPGVNSLKIGYRIVSNFSNRKP